MGKDELNNGNQNEAEEPEVEFEIFSSFEEQEKEDIKWFASLTPEKHLQNATSLIKRVFAEDLKKHPAIGNEIYFK